MQEFSQNLNDSQCQVEQGYQLFARHFTWSDLLHFGGFHYLHRHIGYYAVS